MVKMKRTILSEGKVSGVRKEGGSGSGSGGESDTMESSDSPSDPHCLNCGRRESLRREGNNLNSFSKSEEEYLKRGRSENFKGLHFPSSGQRHWSPLLFLVIIYLVMMLSFFETSSHFVAAVDMHPHGGFYQRGGGNDFYSSAQSSAQQQSDFGGSDDMIGDMIMTCSRPMKSSRAAKYLVIKQLDIPCDMGDKKSAWCNLPGEKYPWHAVRRFVFENQGLMRRMYGEVRQLSLLRMEFEDDMDDEEEEERHGPPRGVSLPEDHRRNSILTEVLDESLPRVLSETPPEDQILLRDHSHLIARKASTPRTLNFISTTTSDAGSSPVDTTTSASTTSSATTTPVLMSEELMNATEVIIDALSGVGDFNNTAAPTLTTTSVLIGGGDVTETASTPGTMTASTVMARNALGEEIVTEEEATQSTASSDGITETDKDDGEVTITTTEEIQMNYSDQEGELQSGTAAATAGNILEPQMQQQLNDGGLLDNFGSVGGSGSMGSDESHDFLNLDKNHILYFDDVGKNRRPVASGNVGVGLGSNDGMVPSQQPLPTQTGKLKAVNACPVKEEVVAPYWANNTRGEILALLNLYPFEQYIHWERCNHENKQMFCRQGCRCEQQYRLHRLLAFDPTNECRGIFSDWFRFPSCCVCRCYLNEYELMMLNAAGQEPSSTTSSSSAKSAQSRTSDRIRSPRKMLLEQLVDGPDVQGVDDMHFFYKQGFTHEHNHGAQPRRKRSVFPTP